MKKFIFIIGGARSGKSLYAQELAKEMGKSVAFIATLVPQDAEMKKRILLHRKLRPKSWKLIEEPQNIKRALRGLIGKVDVAIIDCLGLFVTNLLCDGHKAQEIEKEIRSIAEFLSKSRITAIVVSNEVGLGIVPDNPLARDFRDIIGRSNQIMACHADVVYVMQAGIPLKIKERSI
jgi:adenosylcobinamide kinase / adenosylcobinamide-phosphate guanylyltransferase